MFNKYDSDIARQEAVCMNLGKNISTLRKKSGLTQEELAKKLGVTAQAVSKWENESSCPDIVLLPEIAQLFGVTVDDLIRKVETDIVVVNEPEQKEKREARRIFPSLEKRKICIVITQVNGKVSRVKVPLQLVRTGLRVGGMFGLEADVIKTIDEAVEAEAFGEILTVEGENGENIVIRIE